MKKKLNCTMCGCSVEICAPASCKHMMIMCEECFNEYIYEHYDDKGDKKLKFKEKFKGVGVK